MQASVRELYARVDERTGGRLGKKYLDRFADIPERHLWEFGEMLSPGSVGESGLVALEPGELRPIVTRRDGVFQAARLLLVTPSIMLPSTAFQFSHPEQYGSGNAARRAAFQILLRLLTLRPLFEDGSIFIAPAKDENGDYLDHLSRDSAVAAELVKHRLGTYLSSRDLPEGLVEDASDLGLGSREGELSKLAELRLPTYVGDVAAFVKLRSSSEEFVELRDALRRSLGYLGQLPLGADRAEAQAIVADELKSALRRFEKRTTKSSTLAGLFHGARSLGVSGLGAASGFTASALAGGLVPSPMVPIATVSGAALATSVSEYLRAVGQRRKDKLIWDVAISFRVERDRG